MPIEISPNDVARAETFIASLLTDNVPEGQYGKGTALRDLTVKAFAFIFAHLQKENAQVRALQSLLNVQSVAVSSDPNIDRNVTVATDAILSNWFIARKSGTFSRGLLTVVVSKKQDYLIKRDQRFQYNNVLYFYPDTENATTDIVIPARDLSTLISTNGAVEGYQFTLRVVAAKSGSNYDVEAADWLDAGNFSPFTLRLFSSEKFSGGENKETTEALISRSNTAIAVRNLINNRSIDATLRDRFTDIKRLITVGMGDPEMRRDVLQDSSITSKLHLGGCYDVYVEMPITQKTFEGQLGGGYVRPDGRATILRDTTVGAWTATAVRLGDVIRIVAGLSEAPQDYIIREILAGELRISETNPFIEATDTAGTFVEYFIYRPLFGANFQVLPTVSTNTTGQTSATVINVNRALLPAGPHYDVVDVMILDPDVGDVNINDVDGFIHFGTRVNTAPAAITASTEDPEFQLTSAFPDNGQSQLVFEELVLPGTSVSATAYNGKTVRVLYETLSGFSTVHDFTRDRFERVLAGNILVRGFHPVYLSFRLAYSLKPTASSGIDEAGLLTTLKDFINTFPPEDIIDTSDLSTVARNYNVNIGTVYPLTIYYTLLLPDGRALTYITTDQVSIDPSKLDPEFVGQLNNPLELSISDRTVRYLTTTARITIEQV